MKHLMVMVLLLVLLAFPGLACSFFSGFTESRPSAETPAATSVGEATPDATLPQGRASPMPTLISGPVPGIAFVGMDRNIQGSGEEIFLIEPDGSEARNLTKSRGDDRHPAWSADGTKLAFSSKRDGNWEIYMMNADGTGQVRLTEHPELDTEPCWSPDGRALAFSSNRAGGFDLYILYLDRNELVRLTDHPAQEHYPDWSPDGRRIIFSSFGGEREGGIYSIDVDGTNLRLLAGGALHYPAWSPSGDRIAVDGQVNDCKFEIYVMNGDGSGLVRIAEHPKSCGGYSKKPSWSPDGRWIVFHSSDRSPGTPRPELMIIGVDGSGERQLTGGASSGVGDGGLYPAWSPVR